MSAIRGRALELSLVRASRAYRAAGRRCVLVRQHAPVFTRGDGSVGSSDTGAPVDLIGAVDGEPWALEAKMTAGLSMPLKAERESQRGALQMLFINGFTVALVIEFVDQGEVYSVPWSAMDDFERAPWRRSLSIDFCRAYGLLLPEIDRDAPKQRRTLFLDGAPHRDQAGAVERVEAERRAAPALTLDEPTQRPGKRQRELAARLAQPAPHPSDREAYQRYMQQFVAAGIDRQLGASGKKRKWGRKRG